MKFFLFLLLLLAGALQISIANTAPVLVRLSPENATPDTIVIVKGQSITFSVNGTDVDGNMVSVEWYNNDTYIAESFPSTGNRNLTHSVSFNTVGKYAISCVVYDNNGIASNGIRWEVKTIDPIAAGAPLITRLRPGNLTADTVVVVKGRTLTFSAAGTDADGDLKGVEWYNNSSVAVQSYPLANYRNFTRSITFDSIGTYSISCVLFDNNMHYSSGVRWEVKVVERERFLYVDYGEEIFSVAKAEDSLLQFANRNGITLLGLYGFEQVVEGNHAVLNNFIGKMKSNGIKRVSVVVGDDPQNLQRILDYFDDPSVVHKFDAILTEVEFWNPSPGTDRPTAFNKYEAVLIALRNAANTRNKAFKVETYASNIDTEDKANRICAQVDRVLMEYYTSKITPQEVYYNTTYRAQLQRLCNAVNAKNVELCPLFSKEPNLQGPYPFSKIDSSFFKGYEDDETLVNKYKPIVTNAYYFAYTYANPNALHAPRLMKLLPAGQLKDTIFIQKNDSVTMKLTTRDVNNNLSGVNWYVNGISRGISTLAASGEQTAERTFAFNTSGIFTVTGVPYDATQLYTPQYRWQQRVIVVKDSLVNVALQKNASQSTTVYGGVASRAVDGNRDGTWAGASITHTSESDPNTQAWWQVDLGTEVPIHFIRLYNRTDCCSDRLVNFHIFVSSTPFTSDSVAGSQMQPGVSDFYSSRVSGNPHHAGIYKSGRYIRIQLAQKGVPLNLAEVEVYKMEGAGNCQEDSQQRDANPDSVAILSHDGRAFYKTQPHPSEQLSGVKIYPNPTTNVLYAEIPDKARLSIMTTDGRQIRVPVEYSPGRASLQTTRLPAGVYLLSIYWQRTVKTLRFIKY